MKRVIPTVAASLLAALLACGRAAHTPRRSPANSVFQPVNRALFNVAQSAGYGAAIPAYRASADAAIAMGDFDYSVKFLNNLGACQMGIFQFQAALKTLTEARQLAESGGYRAMVASLNSNISSLYEQMGNLSDAAKAAEEAAQDAGGLEEVPRASLYSQLGTMRAKMGQTIPAEEAFAKSIDLALDAAGYTGTNPPPEPGAMETAAWAWDSLAYARLKAGKIDLADEAASQGFLLRKIIHSAAIDSSYMNLASIRAKQGDLASALRLIGEAEKGLDRAGHVTPPWRIYIERGQIEFGAGDLAGAFQDLLKSRQLARDWRVSVIANDANRTSSEAELANELYDKLILAGNRLYLANRDEPLIRETFEAAEENRSASLRALLPRKNDWRTKLPARYYAQLAKLKAMETAGLVRGVDRKNQEMAALRSDLQEMEAESGAEAQPVRGDALAQAMRSLDGRSALLSFQLGKTESWLWAVTQNSISLHRLPPREELTRQIGAFQLAAEGNKDTLKQLGRDLYGSLFSGLQPAVLSRERWILLLDRELFELPFPALSTEDGTFLIESHSLQVASGALMLRANGGGAAARRGFLGVGDPVYNLADGRVRGAARPTWPSLLMRANYNQGPALARLWGTGREIDASAKTWNVPPNKLLKGADASPESFWAAASAKPDIIHFATHIVEGNEAARTGWIALSLDGNAQVQYITPSDILARTVTARLVVLSGCSSGKADAPSATGLMGLTRAWIAAGAGGVLATRWPTVDDDGSFFQAFYRNLRQSDNIDPTEALRQASLEVLKTKTWRSAPSFWAGYFLVGNS